MGVGGGLLGAFFNGANEKLAHVRSRWVTVTHERLIEVAFLVFLTSVVGYGVSCSVGECVSDTALNLPLYNGTDNIPMYRLQQTYKPHSKLHLDTIF